MRTLKVLLLGCSAFMLPTASNAQDCGGNALGTSRVMEVPFSQGPVGRTNYAQTLPLERGEVVLTFDDGPMPRRTPAVLDALRAECVKATFFVVGTMVAEFPDILRRTASEGHTIATHTWSHQYLNRVRDQRLQRDQINGGLMAARAVLGDADPTLSPFFRYPGLGNTPALDRYVGEQRLVPFSIDVEGDDWRRISPTQVMERVLTRLDAAGKGIILLHDIQARTVAILPELLRRLKAKGYRVVHVVSSREDTRLALNAISPPGAGRIQVALNRLETKAAGVRMASRETGRNVVATAAATMVNDSLVSQRPMQVASADFELLGLRSSLKDVAAPRQSPALQPMSETVRIAIMPSATELQPKVLQSALAEVRSPATVWVDPPVRPAVKADAVLSVSITHKAAPNAASSVSEVRAGLSPPATALREASSLPQPSVSSNPIAPTSPSRQPVPVAAIEKVSPKIEPPFATASIVVAASLPQAEGNSSKTIGIQIANAEDIQRPRREATATSSAVPVHGLTSGLASVAHQEGIPRSAPDAPSRPAIHSATGGFVVLAVAPGARAGFQEITLQR